MKKVGTSPANDDNSDHVESPDEKVSPFEAWQDTIPLDQPLHTTSKDLSQTSTFNSLLSNHQPKLVAIYYSMHNCPPCREFTPILKALYEELNEGFTQTNQKVMEVIFFSGDKTEQEFQEYYGEMPWLALPRTQKQIMMKNAKKFEVKGVPRLVMLNGKDGSILSKQCFEQVK